MVRTTWFGALSHPYDLENMSSALLLLYFCFSKLSQARASNPRIWAAESGGLGILPELRYPVFKTHKPNKIYLNQTN